MDCQGVLPYTSSNTLLLFNLLLLKTSDRKSRQLQRLQTFYLTPIQAKTINI